MLDGDVVACISCAPTFTGAHEADRQRQKSLTRHALGGEVMGVNGVDKRIAKAGSVEDA